MTKLTLAAPTPGLSKVRLTKLLQSELGLSLSEAKGITDRLADGETVVLQVATLEAADRAARSAAALGARATVDRPALLHPGIARAAMGSNRNAVG